MLRVLVGVTFLCSLGLQLVKALPNGPPIGTCGNRLPVGHGGASNAGDLGYSINVETSNTPLRTINPGQTITITLSNAQGVSYRGIMIQVLNGAGTPSGTFASPNLQFQIVQCPNFPPDSTIAHNSRVDKTIDSFMWTAPTTTSSTCPSSDYVVVATVVNSFLSYQIDLQFPLTCVEFALPPVGTQLPPPCQFFDLTMVPNNKYNTSFEMDGEAGMNGWTNNGWTRNSGGTPSIGTGPDGAAQGNYYLYFEASYPPSLPGDRASLATDQDLRGCFCVHFDKHANIFNDEAASLAVFANNNPLYYSSTPDNEWDEMQLQVETPDLTQIRIEYTKGFTHLGDIAIDRVMIEPGPCVEDDE